MTIPKQMIEIVARVHAGNVSKAQWDANPDLHGDHWEYAEKALKSAGVSELIEALQLAECVYRKNCVAEGEPSSVLDAMQAALKRVGAYP